jgi:Flp pilus assembly protein CpaB
MIIGEYTLYKLECEGLVEVVELQELRVLAISQQAQILEDGECITCGRTKGLSVSVWKSN